MARLADELLALEHAGWKSLCDGTGDTVYGGLMTENAVMVLANGMVMDRAAVVSALVYIGTAWRDRQDEPFVGAMSSVYHHTEDGWRLVLYQQSARS